MKQDHKHNPFKIPEDYFEAFSGNLMKRVEGKDDAIPKKDGFVVPDGYFDNLHDTIKPKLNVSRVKVIPLHRYRKYYFAAASIAAIVALVFTLNRGTADDITFEDIASSDIENYFENYASDFSSYEIAEVVPVDELEITDLMANSLNNEIILNYLDNNTDEFEELNLEYDE
ncbi:hypothetical protein LCGC14_1664190 [marine sediment metagenome]|uniref:Uncharacterized protein n=2 Tax=root TaxID=1 RepID=A0A831QSI7_9FLAO|nr:hypothetical protein [Pricia antarctica]